MKYKSAMTYGTNILKKIDMNEYDRVGEELNSSKEEEKQYAWNIASRETK